MSGLPYVSCYPASPAYPGCLNVRGSCPVPPLGTNAAGGEAPAQTAAAAHCWNIRYYQPYFNVESADVLSRLRCAMVAYKGQTIFDQNTEADL